MTATVDRPMTTPPAGSTERLDPWRDFAGEAWRVPPTRAVTFQDHLGM